MVRTRLLRRTVPVLLTSVLLTLACTPGSGPGTDHRETEPRPSEPDAIVAPLEWSDCAGGECAQLRVPLDHEDPDGERITIALLRRPAADPGSRIGSLVVNPGGPGASGVELARRLRLPEQVTDRFDIVGFDPRGVGDSTALDCPDHLRDLYDADPTPETEADRDEFVTVSQAFVDDCAAKHADLLPHLGTVSVARDIDLIRTALGEDRLDYLGFSYGTVIGQQYARLFPERVRTMVLDGVADAGNRGLDGAVEQALAFERAIDAFIGWCDAQGCVDGSAGDLVDAVIARSEEAPIPSFTGDRPATRGVVNLAIDQALYAEWLWPDLADALTAAARGDGSGLVRLADDYLGRIDTDGGTGFETYFAVSCLDADWPDDPDVIFDRAAQIGEIAPRTAEGIVNDYVRCALWPAESQPLDEIPDDLVGLGPILLVSTTGDPATPHETAVALAGRIPGARLITYRGEGHTIVGQGVACVDDEVVDLLLTGRAPDRDLVC